MRALESSPIENLEGQVEGTRFFVVQVFDPETKLYVRGSIAIPPDHLERLRERCVEIGVEFEEGLPQAAAAEIMHQIWGQSFPDGHEVTAIVEVSKSELLGYVRERNERREGSLSS